MESMVSFSSSSVEKYASSVRFQNDLYDINLLLVGIGMDNPRSDSGFSGVPILPSLSDNR